MKKPKRRVRFEPLQMLKAQEIASPMERALDALLLGEILVNDKDEVIYKDTDGRYFTLSEGLKAIFAYIEVYNLQHKKTIRVEALAEIADALKLKQVLRETTIRQCMGQLRTAQRIMSQLSSGDSTKIINVLRIRNHMEAKPPASQSP